MLKSSCSGCGTASDLYGSNCKHMTLCLACGKSMAETHAACSECGVPVTRLIREYNVRPSNISDKSYFIGRFVQGLPAFSKKKGSEAKWSLHKEGLKGRQLTDALREKYKNKPWLLEDETGQQQYQGQLEGAQHATYYLLMMHGKEFLAIPAGSWYNFSKVAQYKQLTLEEAEEKMKNRRKTADGFQRWMMKAANNGAAAFGEVDKFEGGGSGGGGGGEGRRKKGDDDDDDTVVSDRGEEDEDEEEARKSRLGLNKKGDDDEEGTRGGDVDLDDDEVERGDDWEHEEVFTDDDEAVGNDPAEREDLAPELPAPPEIKQDDEDEDGEGNEEEGEGLSKSGKELKKLLGKRSANESDDEDDEYEDVDDEIGLSPVLAPKQKDIPKEEPIETTPTKEKTSASSNATPTTAKSQKGKRKSGSDDVKSSGAGSTKKLKTEDSKSTAPSTVKEESTPSKNVSSSAKQAPPASNKAVGAQATGAVTEEEVRTALRQMAPVTTQELVAKFKARLKTPDDKSSFAAVLKKISRIQKTNGANFVVLRDK